MQARQVDLANPHLRYTLHYVSRYSGCVLGEVEGMLVLKFALKQECSFFILGCHKGQKLIQWGETEKPYGKLSYFFDRINKIYKIICRFILLIL